MKVQWRSVCLSGGVVYTVWHNCLPQAISLWQHLKQIAGLEKKKRREGGNLPKWGIDFVWPKRVLHSWSWQQESSETCFTNRRAKAPMQNYFLTASGKITHSCAPLFFFFTDDTILSSQLSAGAPHGHFSDLKLHKLQFMPLFFFLQCKQGETYTCFHSILMETRDFPLGSYMSNFSHFPQTVLHMPALMGNPYILKLFATGFDPKWL